MCGIMIFLKYKYIFTKTKDARIRRSVNGAFQVFCFRKPLFLTNSEARKQFALPGHRFQLHNTTNCSGTPIVPLKLSAADAARSAGPLNGAFAINKSQLSAINLNCAHCVAIFRASTGPEETPKPITPTRPSGWHLQLSSLYYMPHI